MLYFIMIVVTVCVIKNVSAIDEIHRLAKSKLPESSLYTRGKLAIMAVRALNAFVDDKNIVGYRSFPFSNDIVKDSDRFTTYALKETCKTAIRSIDGVFEWDSKNTMFSNSKPGYICSIPYFDEVIVVPVDPFSPSETKYIIVKLCFEMDEPLIDFSYQRTNENGEIMNPNEVGCAYALFAPLKLHNI